jgi:hypothetical protein
VEVEVEVEPGMAAAGALADPVVDATPAVLVGVAVTDTVELDAEAVGVGAGVVAAVAAAVVVVEAAAAVELELEELGVAVADVDVPVAEELNAFTWARSAAAMFASTTGVGLGVRDVVEVDAVGATTAKMAGPTAWVAAAAPVGVVVDVVAVEVVELELSPFTFRRFCTMAAKKPGPVPVGVAVADEDVLVDVGEPPPKAFAAVWASAEEDDAAATAAARICGVYGVGAGDGPVVDELVVVVAVVVVATGLSI